MITNSYHHGDLRNALIEKGIELINSEGINMLSLRKVASLCGVSQAAPYSHFKSKEDLLYAMQEHVTELFMQVLKSAIASCENRSDPFVLIQMGKAYVTFFIDNPHYFSFLFSQAVIKADLSLEGDNSENFPPYELIKALRVMFSETACLRRNFKT